MTEKLTHLDETGAARMVDVGAKDDTTRIAIAEGMVKMNAETLTAVQKGNAAKGDVLAAARIAGIMAAKKTSDIIPLCHPLLLSKITIDFTLDEAIPAVFVRATVQLSGKTGVEMEALTAVSVACLTIYDMAKAIDKGMTISNIRLMEKQGGKSGHWKRKGD